MATKRKRFTGVRLDERQLSALAAVKRNIGVPISEQVRRAIDAYLAQQPAGWLKPTAPSGRFADVDDARPPVARRRPRRKKG